MKNNVKRFVTLMTALFTFIILNLTINGIVRAEESRDFIRKPPDSWHMPFAPSENPIDIPDQKPKGVTVRVKEITTYEVVVDEEKLKSNTLTMEDLELTEVHDKKKINFHQVDCYFYAKVKQTQTRSTDYVESMRWREGQQYWLSDGGKYVEWEPWSEWYDGRAKW